MPIILEATNTISQIEILDLRKRCARAFYDSLAFESPLVCNHPDEIEKRYEIPIDTQVNCRICLPKDLAINFLNEMHKRASRRDFAVNKFEQKFGNGNKPAKNGKALVFSYGQILHIVNLRVTIPFPSELIEYLPEGHPGRG
jgi:hypothetical protein